MEKFVGFNKYHQRNQVSNDIACAFFHGIGGESGYRPFLQKLSQKGIDVFSAQTFPGQERFPLAQELINSSEFANYNTRYLVTHSGGGIVLGEHILKEEDVQTIRKKLSGIILLNPPIFDPLDTTEILYRIWMAVSTHKKAHKWRTFLKDFRDGMAWSLSGNPFREVSRLSSNSLRDNLPVLIEAFRKRLTLVLGEGDFLCPPDDALATVPTINGGAKVRRVTGHLPYIDTQDLLAERLSKIMHAANNSLSTAH